MSKTNVEISVVVPVHNEEIHLETLYTRLTKTMERMDLIYEIVFVDDGSKDRSFDILKKIGEKDDRIKIIQLSRNFGQHPAVVAGFKFSTGDIVVTIDADLQNPPEEIPKLVLKSKEGYGMVSGWRIDRKDKADRLFLSRIGNILVSRLTGIKLHDYGCMLRAYSREVINQVLLCPEKFKAIPALIAWLSPSSIIEVKIKHNSRKHGKSNYKIYDLIRLALGLIAGYSTFPLQVVSFLGMFFTLLGVAGLIGIFIKFISYQSFPPNIFMILSVFLFFYGILLFSIGLVGEYIGRIFVEVQGRPYYIVKQIVG